MDTRACCSHLDKKREDVHFDVLLKCWDLPKINSNHASHCGSHSFLVGMLCKEPSFRKLMKDCQELVDHLFSRKKQDVVRVACCDSHGIHRSYAVATILQGVCEVSGYTSTGPVHIDECNWKEKICTNCKGCRPNNQKTQLYEMVATHW